MLSSSLGSTLLLHPETTADIQVNWGGDDDKKDSQTPLCTPNSCQFVKIPASSDGRAWQSHCIEFREETGTLYNTSRKDDVPRTQWPFHQRARAAHLLLTKARFVMAARADGMPFCSLKPCSLCMTGWVHIFIRAQQ